MTINSYGIILYRQGTTTLNNEEEFLLVCRKDTVSYVVFLRGLYNREMVPILAERMTKDERHRILNEPFDMLWDRLWQYHPSRKYHHRQKFKKEKERAKDRFEKYEWKDIFDVVSSKYDEPEWGFPKGRKKKAEKPIEAALREFNEETGIDVNDVVVYRNLPPIIERYIGTDSKQYQIMYFLATLVEDSTTTNSTAAEKMTSKDTLLEMHHDDDDPDLHFGDNVDDSMNTNSEISKIAWFTRKNAMNQIRDYHVAKKTLLQKLRLPK